MTDPYRCHVENLDFAEPQTPTTYGDYPLPQSYGIASSVTSA